MENEQLVVDCLVMLDGQNKSFFSYMDYEQAQFLQEVGLEGAKAVILKETEDRPISKSLLNGESAIVDILVKLEPNVCIYLN